MSLYAPLLRAGSSALAPLERALTDPEAFASLLGELGWGVPVDEADLDAVRGVLPALDALERLAELSGDLGGEAALVEAAELLAEIAVAVAALARLRAEDVADLPMELASLSTWADLAGALPAHLLGRWLTTEVPALAAALRATGVLARERSRRGGAARWALHWERLGTALSDPAGAVAATYGWPDRFADAPLLGDLALAFARLGLTVAHRPLTPAVRAAIESEGTGEALAPMETEIRFLLGIGPDGGGVEAGLLLASAATAGAPAGLYVGNQAYGELGADLPLSESWTLSAVGEVQGTATAGAILRPGAVRAVSDAPSSELELRLTGRPPAPWRLLGEPDGTRLELTGLDVALGAVLTTADAELWVSAAVPADGLEVVVALGGADSMLQDALGGDLTAKASGGLRWSTATGLGFSGGAGLEVTIPVERAIGPVTVHSLRLALDQGDGGGRFEVTLRSGVALGPLQVTVHDLGAALVLTPGDDGLAADLAFVPPTGLGLALEMGEGVHGGGFVGHEPDTGRYFGALALEFGDYGLGATLVADTRLPAEPSWALFASISGTFPGIPLGFGFVLTGVGGIFCLNRTMDIGALATGIKSGAADAIMFPDDPVGQGPQIVSELDAWFPRAEGSSVFGLDAQIAWGAKALITAEFGILVSFPELDIVVLGTLTSILPEADKPTLELHMDTLGVLDLDEGTFWITSVLYDSSLVQTIHLSGGSALYARFTGDPFFLLSVGGYHPSFQPPGGLPGAIVDLDRMRAELTLSDDVSFSLEAYFAVTSNSLQFGSDMRLELSSRFLGVTYAARGEIAFDVLLVFSPFSFVVDFEASVTITAGSNDRELLAVELSAHLEGPQPWYATGHARFTFLCVDVRFEIEVGGNAPAEAPPRQNVLDLVHDALLAPTAWRSVAPSTSTVLAPGDAAASEDEVWARPDATLEVIQEVAPLNRALDHYGAYDIDGPSTLTIVDAGVDGLGASVTWEAASDYFAPAQYDDMTRAETLSAPSFEQMTAGVRFGVEGISVPPADHVRVVEPRYERAVIDGDQHFPLKAAVLDLPMATATFAHLASGVQPVRSDAGPFAIAAVTWATVDAVTGRLTGSPGSYRETLGEVRAAPRGTQKIAPTYAARGA